jgi:hypothetical protein
VKIAVGNFFKRLIDTESGFECAGHHAERIFKL